jgi:hypothetical protein
MSHNSRRRLLPTFDGDVPEPEKTFVHYWLKNAGQSEHFRRKDIVFECFHNPGGTSLQGHQRPRNTDLIPTAALAGVTTT